MTVCHQFSRRIAPRPEARGQDVSLTWISDTDDGPTSWRDLGQLDWSRFRLVLGAGGATGAAFEAGILLALTIDHGVDLRQASHLVGTSAGSVIGALIAMGLDGEDLAAVIARAPEWMSPVGGSYDLTFGEQRPPTPNLRNLMRPLRPRDMVRFAELAATRRYRALWLHCVKPGTFDLTEQLPFIPGLAWPSDVRLSVCCSDSASGDRVVYERDAGVKLADAVAASCAVPGVIRPVAIGDRLLVDGGVVSPTNADLALEDGEATVTVIVSPMSGKGAHSALGRASSMFATRRLLSELRRSHASGDVLVIEPSESLGALVIDDALDASATTRVLGGSFLAPSRAAVTRREISPRRPTAADH